MKLTDAQGEKLGGFKWKTKDGKVLRWRDMDVDHLLNCVKMLRRVAQEEESAVWQFASMCQGEMSSYYADQECDYVMDRNLVREERARLMESYAEWRKLFPCLGEGVFHV